MVKLLTKAEIDESATIEIHFFNALNKGFKSLEEFGSKRPMELNNALLGLYAQQIYQQVNGNIFARSIMHFQMNTFQMVLSKRNEDRKKYCLRVAADLLIPDASSLYISTFSSDELQYMSKTVRLDSCIPE